ASSRCWPRSISSMWRRSCANSRTPRPTQRGSVAKPGTTRGQPTVGLATIAPRCAISRAGVSSGPTLTPIESSCPAPTRCITPAMLTSRRRWQRRSAATTPPSSSCGRPCVPPSHVARASNTGRSPPPLQQASAPCAAPSRQSQTLAALHRRKVVTRRRWRLLLASAEHLLHVDALHPRGQLVLQRLELLHGRHATSHARHTWHSRHPRHALAVHALRGTTVLVPALLPLALTVVLLLLRRRTATRHTELTSHAPHHLLRFEEALDQLVDLGDLHTRTSGNALAAGGIQDLRVVALRRGHTSDDGLNAVQLLLVDHVRELGHLGAARKHLQDIAERTHLADHHHLLEEVLQRQLAGCHALGRAHGLLLVHDLLGLLDQ